MPIRFWTHPCCGWESGRRTCLSHRLDATVSRWRLGMHEAMFRYELRCGWKPIGPHRQLGDALYGAVAKGCRTCDGNGLIDRLEGASYAICESCHGFGTLPLPGAPEIDAIRRQVAEAYPDEMTAYDPASAIRRLRAALSGDAVVVHDLGAGAMLDSSTPPTGGAR